jgi:hypothetical protein
MKREQKIGIPKLNVFEANAAELRRMKEAVKAAWLRRNDGDVHRRVWQEALERFHSSYCDLAFPGGIAKAFVLLEKNDPDGVEMVVRFLEADPWYFRSGYHKAEMLRLLRKTPLTEDQRKRLQQVILARVESRYTPREFRWYCRLARFVSDRDFEQEIARLAEQPRTIRGQHACWVLTQIRAARKSSVDK